MNIEKIDFSVVVPVYNVEKYLHNCIDSVLCQTYQNFELILIDDGSTDASGEICDSYISDKVRVVHQENKGHTSARYKGAEIAVGNYIVFVDSDDTIEEEFLDKIYRRLSETEADIVQVNMRTFIEDGDYKKILGICLKDGLYGFREIQNMVLPCLMMNESGMCFPRSLCGKAIKKDVVLNALKKVPVEIRTGEDMCCVIAMFDDVTSLYVLSDTFYNYREVEGSISRKGDPEALKRCRYALKFLSDHADNDIMIPQYERLSVQQVYSACVRALRSSKIKYVKKEYKKLIMESDFKQSLKKASFTNKKLAVKQMLLRFELFYFIKLIDKRER